MIEKGYYIVPVAVFPLSTKNCEKCKMFFSVCTQTFHKCKTAFLDCECLAFGFPAFCDVDLRHDNLFFPDRVENRRNYQVSGTRTFF